MRQAIHFRRASCSGRGWRQIRLTAVRIDVEYEVARDRLFRNIERKGAAAAHPELGHSVHVEVDGLEPGRDCWFRFRAGDETSQTGRARTARTAARTESVSLSIAATSHTRSSTTGTGTPSTSRTRT